MHATHIIHTLGPGGAEQVLVDLAHAAHAGGFSMSVVALVGDADLMHAQGLRKAGIAVRCLGLGSRWDLRAFGLALGAVRVLEPAVVHTHLKHADIVGAAVARRLRIAQVSTLHVIEDNVGGAAAAKRWAAGRVRSASATRTVAVSEAQREWYLANFPVDGDRVVTIHNGVAPGPVVSEEARTATRASFGCSAHDVLAANVAIMRTGKGHDDLLAALTLLPEASNLRLLLIGDGPEKRRLEEAVAADSRLARRVVFAGYRADVPALLQAVDLVVHPTHADALPTALIHALAAGVPIIATDVGGVPEVVGAEAGILLPAGAPALLARTLHEVAEDPRRRAEMGAAGRRRFLQEFEASRWAQRLGALYREVAASAP